MLFLPILSAFSGLQNGDSPVFTDPKAGLERTVFQTHSHYDDRINLRADVAIVYGIDASMPARVKEWRDRGYKVHLMTGVAWGEYQDYYYGRWDGINHEGEAQTRANGEKIGHGGDVYYMSPGAKYGLYLAEGVRRALAAGVEAVHLEEPEFWVGGGYGEGFKSEWQAFYHEPWQDPSSSVDARWHAAKLMYFLYRRALQQVFDSVSAYNREHGTHVRCYVPTHSLLNYASWGIVSPESSLAKLKGSDGYIAQVWTGTARTPNRYRGVRKERTFETAFLEYGSMQNLVRSTGRSVWYLADPIEDNPDHDWDDYRFNYHSTLLASLLQPDVSQYEVIPWPERVFHGKYPSPADKKERVGIPDAYATELQVLFNALKDMKQKSVEWQCGSQGIGLLVSDSLMFERGGPDASDDDFGHVYGLALPFVKRGMPIQPVQLENVGQQRYLKGFKVLLMTYEGMKPLSPEVHDAIAKWVRDGGSLVFVDADADPFAQVREWWNRDGKTQGTPRLDLFETLGVGEKPGELTRVGKGNLVYLRRSPTEISQSPTGDRWLMDALHRDLPSFPWRESASLVLRRGPYVVAMGMDETDSPRTTITGDFVDLFDANLSPTTSVSLGPSSQHLLVDLAKFKGSIVASAGYTRQDSSSDHRWVGITEGIADTKGVLLLRIPRPPVQATLDGEPLDTGRYDATRGLLWLHFVQSARAKRIEVQF